MAEFVTVFTSVSLSEIYIAQAKLEEAGILSFTRDERLHQTAPYLSSLTNGIQLQVEESDIDRAVQLLQEAGMLIPRVEKKDDFFRWLKWIFLAVLLLELFYLLHKNKVL